MLWSDRAAQQGAGSLRQALRQIRLALQHTGIVLEADRRNVRLDLDTISVSHTGEGEFLEGLDIRDEQFEHWLVIERSRRDGSPKISVVDSGFVPEPSGPWHIALIPGSQTGVELWFETSFCDVVSRNITESLNATVSIGQPAERRDRQLEIGVQGFSLNGAFSLRLSLRHQANNHQIWAGSRSLPLEGAPPIDRPEGLGLISEMTEALTNYIRHIDGTDRNDDPDILCARAIRALFTMRADRVREADALFAKAFDLKPRGLYLAWRAKTRTINRVEQHSDDIAGLIEEGREFSFRALEMEPQNSMVLSHVADTAGHLLNDKQRSFELSKNGVLLNPANPMAWSALSSAQLYLGNLADSRQAAIRGRNLALMAHNRFWWDQQLFGVTLLMGNLDEALRLCRTTTALNPHFRPPSRYLIALYAHFGQLDAASRVAEKLQQEETDFSVERLIDDQDYPASLLRRAPGLDLGPLQELVGR
jgi:tetratricopeptide (TPR) repeat protein